MRRSMMRSTPLVLALLTAASLMRPEVWPFLAAGAIVSRMIAKEVARVRLNPRF